MGLTARMVIAYAALVAALVGAILLILDQVLAAELHSGVILNGRLLAATLSEAISSEILLEDGVGALRILQGARRSDASVRYAFVVDSSGRPVCHTFDAGVPAELLTAVGPAAPGSPSVRPLRTEDGLLYDVSSPILGGRLGALHLGVTTRDVDDAVAHIRRTIVAVAGLVLLLGGAASIAIARSLTRPLGNLVQAAVRVQGGDLTARAAADGPAEYRVLARTWNGMTETLAQRIAEISAHESYQARLLDSMGDEVSVVGSGHRVECANRGAREALGPTDGRPCAEACGVGGRRPCRECPADRVLETGEPVFTLHEAPDGTVSEIAFTPLDLPDGSRAVVERSRDVTELHRLKRRLVEIERMALLGEIAAGIAHEVGNPLDGIRGCLDVARRIQADPSRLDRFLALADEGVGRIEAIIRRLLAYARPRALAKERVSMNEVVEQGLALVSMRAEHRGIRLERRLAADLPAVEADPGALSQVLVNLVLNAIDAVEAKGQGTGAVIVETLARDGDRPAVGFRVVDNGVGIAPEVREKVGSPFFTTKAPGKGTGLGLSVSRRLVEQHAGWMEIESEPGAGARFAVLIPTGEVSGPVATEEVPCAAAS